MLVLTTWKK